MDDAYLKCKYVGRKCEVYVDKSLKKAPEKVVKGGLAHEAAHIYRDYKRNVFSRALDSVRYAVDIKKQETRNEREADMLVVKRGYGEELLAFLKYHDKRRKKHKKKDGLTVKELKKILKG